MLKIFFFRPDILLFRTSDIMTMYPSPTLPLSERFQVETAAVAVPKVETQAEAAKSHFGGRVQVGGHVAGGLRIS